MRLNHLNLCVDDLAQARDLFQRHFDFHLVNQKGDAIAVMTDGDGFTLVLSNRRAFGDDSPIRYPEGFHVGFFVAARDEVDQAYTRLAAADVEIGHAPRVMHGSYTFYFTALNAILFEVACPI